MSNQKELPPILKEYATEKNIAITETNDGQERIPHETLIEYAEEKGLLIEILQKIRERIESLDADEIKKLNNFIAGAQKRIKEGISQNSSVSAYQGNESPNKELLERTDALLLEMINEVRKKLKDPNLEIKETYTDKKSPTLDSPSGKTKKSPDQVHLGRFFTSDEIMNEFFYSLPRGFQIEGTILDYSGKRLLKVRLNNDLLLFIPPSRKERERKIILTRSDYADKVFSIPRRDLAFSSPQKEGFFIHTFSPTAIKSGILVNFIRNIKEVDIGLDNKDLSPNNLKLFKRTDLPDSLSVEGFKEIFSLADFFQNGSLRKHTRKSELDTIGNSGFNKNTLLSRIKRGTDFQTNATRLNEEILLDLLKFIYGEEEIKKYYIDYSTKKSLKELIPENSDFWQSKDFIIKKQTENGEFQISLNVLGKKLMNNNQFSSFFRKKAPLLVGGSKSRAFASILYEYLYNTKNTIYDDVTLATRKNLEGFSLDEIKEIFPLSDFIGPTNFKDVLLETSRASTHKLKSLIKNTPDSKNIQFSSISLSSNKKCTADDLFSIINFLYPEKNIVQNTSNRMPRFSIGEYKE
jgi:hypothetical protein